MATRNCLMYLLITKLHSGRFRMQMTLLVTALMVKRMSVNWEHHTFYMKWTLRLLLTLLSIPIGLMSQLRITNLICIKRYQLPPFCVDFCYQCHCFIAFFFTIAKNSREQITIRVAGLLLMMAWTIFCKCHYSLWNSLYRYFSPYEDYEISLIRTFVKNHIPSLGLGCHPNMNSLPNKNEHVRTKAESNEGNISQSELCSAPVCILIKLLLFLAYFTYLPD
jgi:hypothetical protein